MLGGCDISFETHSSDKGLEMNAIVFVLPRTYVLFPVEDKEAAIKIIADFENTLNQVTQAVDKLFWGMNKDGLKTCMVRCSQVVGLYYHESTPFAGEEWKTRHG